MSIETLQALLWVIIAAALAPIIVDIIPKVTLPVVVIELLLGIALGPQLLGLIDGGNGLDIAREFGVIFLFFLAGFEVDYLGIKGDPLRNALRGWGFSFLIAAVITFAMQQMGLISHFPLVAIAICTTALGPLMPILQDSDQLPTPFGRNAISIGALGEFIPVLLLAFLYNDSRTGIFTAFGLVVFFAAVLAILIAFQRSVGRSEKSELRRIAIQTLDSSAQFGVRLAMLVLVGLVFLAARFDLDVLLGAFASGFIVGRLGDITSNEDSRKIMGWMKTKFEAIGFGVFIPAFFIVTGASLDIGTLLESNRAMLIVPLTAIAYILVRGLPILLGYKTFDLAMRWRLALVASTQLPLVATLMGRFMGSGIVPEDVGTAIIGGSVLSVALFPFFAFLGLEVPEGPKKQAAEKGEKIVESLPEISVQKAGK